MAVKYQIRTVVDRDIKEWIADLMKISGHSESKQTKLLLARMKETDEKLKALNQ